MKTIEGILIEGKLGKFISNSYYKIEIEGFEDFTAEAHLYALLEWGRYIRPDYSETDRLKYLYEKCWEYTDSTKHVKFKVNKTCFGYVIDLEKKEEEISPF